MMNKNRVGLYSFLGLAGICALLAGRIMPIGETLASWQDSESTRGTFTAGVVLPPQTLSCVADPVTSTVTFIWTAPVGSADRKSYQWTLTNNNGLGNTHGTASSGVLGAEVSSYVVSGIDNWPIPTTMNFRIVAVGGGSWLSEAKTGRVTRDVVNISGSPLATCTATP